MPSDPAVRYETAAVAAGVSLFTLRRQMRAGRIPPADLTLPAIPEPIRAWRLSTLRKWNPVLAHRCAVILAALEDPQEDPQEPL